MTEFAATDFFALDGWDHSPVFDDGPVWNALGQGLVRYLDEWTDWSISSPIPAGVHLLGERIHIGPDCVIEPGAVLLGPLILGPRSTVRTGAYVRQNVLAAAETIIGAHSEVKGSILLPGAKAPHQNYVGDSILGRAVNLGAGTICSNVKNVGDQVSFANAGKLIHTGLRKFGAVLGDECKTGCNTVLNPGVLMGPGSVTYPNATLRSGYYAPGTLVKVRQQQQIVEMKKLRPGLAKSS